MAQRSPLSPPTAAARRPGPVSALLRPLSPSPGPPPPAEAAQERCASTSRYRTLYAYNHLLTLTIATMTDRALHQPWVHVSSDLYEPVYHVPQARMSMQGSPRRCCRALLRWPLRWPARLQRPLELAAHARHRRQRWWRVHPCGARERSTLGGGSPSEAIKELVQPTTRLGESNPPPPPVRLEAGLRSNLFRYARVEVRVVCVV